MSVRVLLLTPPMTQLNTPYPATAYLTGFLRSRGVDAVQADPAIELCLRLLSREGLAEARATLEARPGLRRRRAAAMPPAISHFLAHADRILALVDPVIHFLQGKDPSLALRIAGRELLPEGPRFAELEEEVLREAFGGLGLHDRARYLASLFVDDLADLIREGIDPRFELSRYGEKLAASSASFAPLAEALNEAEPTLVDRTLDAITAELLAKHEPDVIGITAPFPGNVYGAFRIARAVRKLRPGVKLILGGGYVNTELRELAEPRVFDYFDFLTLDDGEKPFLCVLEHLEGKRGEDRLLRTLVRDVVTGTVQLRTCASEHDIPHRDTGTPTYDGLALDRYLMIFEMLNPMHRIWSDWRWNKLTLAHGCYWKKCNFCDVNLDYIGRYDPASAEVLVDRIEALVAETGATGFHFVDEAAPPALLRALAERLLARGVTITWWGNVRFEKAFTPELARLLARSGCVAVSGGLEAASDRLLKLMNKGVTVEQVARVTHALTDAGIMVHAYLMYGFPTQTVAETVDALERVRQLFAAGCIQSAYWHRFSATAHSPIGRNPSAFAIQLRPERYRGPRFARNDLTFDDETGVDHDALAPGLRHALYSYMHGAGFDTDVRFWFKGLRVPRRSSVDPQLVERALAAR